MIRQVSREYESHLDDILRNVLKHILPVTQPPILISQVQHSGGYLLNRLFDGHLEVHALPREIGTKPTATGPWPGIDINDKPQNWFRALFGKVDTAIIRKKFDDRHTVITTLPFVFPPLIQEQVFLKYLESVEIIRQRDVIDAYITACFGAWLASGYLLDAKTLDQNHRTMIKEITQKYYHSILEEVIAV